MSALNPKTCEQEGQNQPSPLGKSRAHATSSGTAVTTHLNPHPQTRVAALAEQ